MCSLWSVPNRRLLQSGYPHKCSACFRLERSEKSDGDISDSVTDLSHLLKLIISCLTVYSVNMPHNILLQLNQEQYRGGNDQDA